MKKSKYKFLDYYKYQFQVRLDDGTIIANEGNGGDIYRLTLYAEGEAEYDETEKAWRIDGRLFKESWV